jgi:general secretion pathway protein G
MKRSRSRRRGGFTLMEVLMVLVILVIIMGLAIGTYTNQQYKARISAAKAQVGLFIPALEAFKFSVGFYPTTNQGLQSLRYPPADLPNPEDWGPDQYIDRDVPSDPWGVPYNYISPGKYNPNGFDVWSCGPDRMDGTADDIGNWTSAR